MSMPQEISVPNLGLGQETQPTDNSPQPSVFGSEFLQGAGVPEQDWAIVSKYLSGIDGQINQKIQSIHEQYTPYKDLGDIDDIKWAMQVNSALRNDPVMFARQLEASIQELIDEGLLDMSDIPGQENVDPNGQQNVLPEYANMDPAFVERFGKMESAIETLSNFVTQSQQSANDAAEMKQLDDFMANLHNEHGDFDDSYVLAQLAQGKSPEQALKAWDDLKENVIGSRQKLPPPNILGGQGNTPAGQVDPSKISNTKDRVAFVTQALQAAQNQ